MGNISSVELVSRQFFFIRLCINVCGHGVAYLIPELIYICNVGLYDRHLLRVLPNQVV